ncbi:MAG: hypothetical protein OMM_15269, partial [Candidatus Magnetoglobus multicellularis str. Araruama]
MISSTASIMNAAAANAASTLNADWLKKSRKISNKNQDYAESTGSLIIDTEGDFFNPSQSVADSQKAAEVPFNTKTTPLSGPKDQRLGVGYVQDFLFSQLKEAFIRTGLRFNDDGSGYEIISNYKGLIPIAVA